MASRSVRVRFAPSPTGPLHIGGVRTALFNYFFARQHQGDFILRIEDTDQARFVEGAEEYIVESLKWCGIKINEGIIEGGPFAPYRQSERKHIYRPYAEQLVKDGHAYYAFDTATDLEKLRVEAEQNGGTFIYNFRIRSTMRNSLNMPAPEVEKLISDGHQWVIRFKVPENMQVHMDDIIRGHVVVDSATLDDKVLFKSSDNLPTYHLANVVDDFLMKISHVIRGEEWLPSLPLHVLLYKALGWQDVMPQFAHLPLLLKPNGNGKLSKRDGDKMGFPVFPLQWKSKDGEFSRGYREDGYFPEAFVNLLSLLGWNPGTEQEVFTMDDLIQQFSLDKVSKSGAKFDPEKARWFNAQWLRMKSDDELAHLFAQLLERKGISEDHQKLEKICHLNKERVNFIHELYEVSDYFFQSPANYDTSVKQKHWKPETPERLMQLVSLLKTIDPFCKTEIDAAIHGWVDYHQYPMGNIMNTFRLCVVGRSIGPGMSDICEILGKDEILKRLETALKVLS